jgi:long-chain acyl-CoA synthetase
MLTHAALAANVEALGALTDPPAATADDVVLAVLPLFHIYGLNAVLAPAAAYAATCVLLDRFHPVETLQLIADRGVTTVAGAPPMYRAWAALPGAGEALAGVRLFTSGGAALPPATHAAFVAATEQPVWEGYGMTETAPVVATTLVCHRPRPGSVGRPLPGWQLRLVEAGEDVDDGDPGEVWVRGPSLFSGYWPDGAGGPDPDGWFNTGDVAYLDDEGDLRLVDRRREVILVSGFTVYPREVEQVVEALQGVAECAVVGIPDARTGEAVAAFVVLRDGATLTGDDVREHSATRLARFKRPVRVTVVESLPHSATGRIAKGRLREVHGV